MEYSSLIEEKINDLGLPSEPSNLYDPIRYILSLGGKRMRPQLVFLGNSLFETNNDDCLNAALAVEIFHNFTLVHDDIMDEAPLRRGNPTVHSKWNSNVGILSGDAMMIIAYQYLNKIQHPKKSEIIDVFNQTALEVCDGQQWDMDFESQQDVSIDDYLNMIRNKTAVLLGASLKIGAILGNASEEDADKMYAFGMNMGVGFQLMDDHLDAFGNPENFGKQVGGDIICNKKTFLLLTALQKTEDRVKQSLLQWISDEQFIAEEKVDAVLNIYKSIDLESISHKEMEKYYTIAFESLNEIDSSEDKKAVVRSFAQSIIDRIK